jgi:predicted metal-binding protein
VVFALSGRIEEKDLSELQKLLEAEAESVNITLDLEEVRLVDREAVKFLAACEVQGMELKSCPSYIREWIEKGRDTSRET